VNNETLDYLSSLSAPERDELLRFLTPEERAEMESLLLMDRRLWRPNPGPQTLAYYSLADKLFYGGQAGGGKTDLLIGLASTAHTKSIIFRREFPQLKDVILRIEEICGPRARTKGSSATYVINDQGTRRILELGSVQHAKSVSKYKGRPHALKCFDEAPDFLEQQFRFLTGWTRTTTLGERTRVVACGNPPTSSEGDWVIVYWAPWLDEGHSNPALPGELRWFAVLGGQDVEVESGKAFVYKGELVQPESRTFIPASLEDNPYLRDGGYRAILQNLPEPLRSQLLYGDFKAGRVDDAWQVIPTKWVELAMERWKQTPRPDVPLTAVGIDVARGGKDQNVFAPRYELWIDELISIPGSDTPNGPLVASALINQVLTGRTEKPDLNVDIIGVGTAVHDTLMLFGYEPHAISFGERSEFYDRSKKLRCVNVRAEAYWRVRELLDPDFGEPVCLPPDRELKADLCAARWGLTASGILIEDKEEIAKRIGHSPDKGDATVLSFMPSPEPDLPIISGSIRRSSAKIVGERL
jgi:hypothetical protein